MKIALSANAPGLDADVDPRFGRCQYFAVGDPDTMEFEFIENASMMAGGGAGISSAQTIVDKGVSAVLTGNCGPNAYQVLSAAGIQVITGVSGTVRQTAEDFKSGKFSATSQPNVKAHFGMGGGGAGSGRGVERMATPMPTETGASVPMITGSTPEEEIESLKEQTEIMKKQIDAIQRRIEELRGKQG